MRRVEWTPRALRQLAEIQSYIGEFDVRAGERMVARLLAAADRLQDYPSSGRSADGLTRELTVVPPYVIRYRIEKERVLVIRVRHGARRPA